MPEMMLWFLFYFIGAVHVMHIMIEVIANKSTLRVTCTNVDTNMILISNITQHHILITQHHYNVAFVDDNYNTTKLLIFLVEKVVTNTLLITMLKTWTAIHVWQNNVVWIYWNNIDFDFFHPYHFCGLNAWIATPLHALTDWLFVVQWKSTLWFDVLIVFWNQWSKISFILPIHLGPGYE